MHCTDAGAENGSGAHWLHDARWFRHSSAGCAPGSRSARMAPGRAPPRHLGPARLIQSHPARCRTWPRSPALRAMSGLTSLDWRLASAAQWSIVHVMMGRRAGGDAVGRYIAACAYGRVRATTVHPQSQKPSSSLYNLHACYENVLCAWLHLSRVALHHAHMSGTVMLTTSVSPVVIGVPARAALAACTCALTRRNQRLQPAANASAVARAVRRQL